MYYREISGVSRKFTNYPKISFKNSGKFSAALIASLFAAQTSFAASCPYQEPEESSEAVSCCFAASAPAAEVTESRPVEAQPAEAQATAAVPAFVFVGLDGQPVVPTEEQLTAINTVILQVAGPKAALKPLNAVTAKAETTPADAAVAAVDAQGNLVAPTPSQLAELAAGQTSARRAEPVTEPLDPNDPAKGFRTLAAESFSFAWMDKDGNLQTSCDLVEAPVEAEVTTTGGETAGSEDEVVK